MGITLPLSGRQGELGGEARSWWWPVHSRGLFDSDRLNEVTILPRYQDIGNIANSANLKFIYSVILQ